MEFILDLLNRIKWDKKEDPSLYTIYYYDRVADINKELKFDDIKEINNLFLSVISCERTFDLPIHRIREVRKGSQIVWKRVPGSSQLGE